MRSAQAGPCDDNNEPDCSNCMNAIERGYQERAARRGDPPLLNPETALHFINECAERGIEVFGFDGFLIAPEDKLQPLMEDMLDFDWKHLNDLTYLEKLEMAKQRIRRRIGTDILFEVVVEDRPKR